MKYLFLAMRPYQWLKNIFIFLPVLFGRRLTDPSSLARTALIFVSFCLVSSAVYLLNDIMDMDEDRGHPEKSKRPLVSGRISVRESCLAAGVLLLLGLPISFALGLYPGITVSVYLMLNMAYTAALKNVVIIDVFCVGAFYYLRVLAGGAANGIELSGWIVICTVLLALFLAFNKRRHDLGLAKDHKSVPAKYNARFLDRMIGIISASVIISYALYAMDAGTIEKFGTNHLIFTVPFVFYGIFRYLYLVDVKNAGGDPSRVLIYDSKMQINIILWIVVCVAVVYFKI
ncbi:MAG: decaprenyl-phosphate phosphoribosyltransferase [Candidatus Omnitrophota bacterium]